MDTEKYLSTFDSRILDFIKQYSIFNNSYLEFENFIKDNNRTDFEQCTQFILLCDDNQIVYSQETKIIPAKDTKLSFDKNVFRYFANALRIWWIQLKDFESQTKYEKINKDQIKNIVDLNQNIKIIILEIPSKFDQKIKDLSNILKYYIDIETLSQKSLFSKRNLQISSILSMAIVVGTTLRVINIVPIQAVNETEILLSLKVFASLFILLILFYALIIYSSVRMAASSSFNNLKFYLSIMMHTWLKEVLIGYIVLAITFGILGNVFPHMGDLVKKYPILSLQVDRIAAEWYLENKTALIFDPELKKPILLLGIKDGVYYYDDEFNNCKLQQKFKDSNLTDSKKEGIIHKSLLNIDTNTSEVYRKYNWKVGSLKDMKFDYNATLINESILKCNETNLSK